MYRDAALAGVAAGVVFGLLIQFALGRMTTIGALFTFGSESLTVGWSVHLVNSSLFATIYALVTRLDSLRSAASAPWSGAATGAGYGFVL